MGWGYSEWKPYVSVGQRLAEARKAMDKRRKKGELIEPVEIKGLKIAKTFWGKGWCDHLESFSDYDNRLPRGRTYARNGSVCHLAIKKGKVTAVVSGSELYDITIKIKPLDKKKWNKIKQQCTGQIGSLLELLQGKLSDSIMSVVTDRKNGLFPLDNEITLDCDCPDWAEMCKHLAAVMYGIGARLDKQPELLFLLRGVDHEELITADAETAVRKTVKKGNRKHLSEENLADIFGIDIEKQDAQLAAERPKTKKTTKKKSVKKKVTKKKTSKKKKAVKKKQIKKKTKTSPKKPVKKKSPPKAKTPQKKTPKKPAKKKKTSSSKPVIKKGVKKTTKTKTKTSKKRAKKKNNKR